MITLANADLTCMFGSLAKSYDVIDQKKTITQIAF